jgi:hypothetical protein
VVNYAATKVIIFDDAKTLFWKSSKELML